PEKKYKVGRYFFGDELHSVASLAQYEIQHPHMDATIRSQVKTLLETAKGDFIKIAEPFVQQARGVKQITLRFMDEWAQKHGKENSSLLRWGREKDGKEFDTFKTETVTFQDLYEFCIDLISFISDLVKSCPCAYQQFQEIQRQAR